MNSAPIEEIFASIQGEGPWIGQRQIFVRFKGCDIRCRYCDTPASARPSSVAGNCRVQVSAGAFTYEVTPDVISLRRVSEFCSRLIVPGPSRPILSLTGGEPLLARDFLAAWLPEARKEFQIYLETNGISCQAMETLRDFVDVVSMDLKLPSATGLRPFWEEHEKFLNAARGTNIFTKAVVTAGTTREDMLTAASLVAAHNPSLPFIIQPAGGAFEPDSALLIDLQNAALGVIGDVRVIPQAHKILRIP